MRIPGFYRCLALVAGLALAVAPLSADTLYVSSFQGGTIHSINLSTGFPVTIVSGQGFLEDGACGPDGRIYFATPNSNIITRWNGDGTSPANIVPSAGAINGPEGLSFDDQGNLYTNTRANAFGTSGAWRIDGADPSNGAVNIVPAFSSFGEGTDIVPAGPHKGALLLASRGEREILISDPPGAPAQVLIDSSQFPPGAALFGVTANGCGEIFVAFRDTPSGAAVYRFDPEGVFEEVFASGTADANFMEFDSDGNLYFTDEQDGKVWMVTPDGTRTEYADIPSAVGIAICRDDRVPHCLSCDAGGPYVAECGGPTTTVLLDGSGSRGPENVTLAYEWTTDCPGGDFGGTENEVQPELTLATTECSTLCKAFLAVSDGTETEECEADILVEDTTPPQILPGAEDLLCIWPPNHWYVCLGREELDPVISARILEACNEPAEWKIVACESDQPEDARETDRLTPFNGDGHTRRDCVIFPDGDGVCVRAERAGAGPTAQDGRHYGLAVVARDECGNQTAVVPIGAIHVPHDQSPPERPCLDPTSLGCRPNEPIPCR